MTLYVLPAANYSSLFGTPFAPAPKADIDIIAQKPDCSSFLVLSNSAYAQLTPFVHYTGYVQTFRQSWGLTIDATVVARIIQTLRAEAYPPAQDYLDALVKGDVVAQQAHFAACLAVKTRYPLVF